MSNRTRWLQAGVFTLVCLGAGAARADNWLDRGSLCAIPMNGPQVFGFTSQSGVWSVWSADGGTSWAVQNIVPDLSNVRPTQLGCAGDGSSQGIVMYRGGLPLSLHSRDRLSGWKDTIVPMGGVGGLTVTLVSDGGRNKFVAFAGGGSTIDMSVWDYSTTAKWSIPVRLDIPGGASSTLPNDLTSYSYVIGNPATQGIASVFVVNNNGHLMENTGPLAGTRTWVDHGIPPGTSGFSQKRGFGPSAVAVAASPFGHPGAYTAADYNLRIVIPAADLSGIYASSQLSGASSFSWTQIAGNTMTASGAVYTSAGRAAGCFNPGEPCSPSVEVGVAYLSLGLISYASYYFGATDGGGMAGWTNQTAPGSDPMGPVAYVPTSWSKRGVLFYVNPTPDTMNIINLDTGAVTAVPHP
jgi:hypothetical protein